MTRTKKVKTFKHLHCTIKPITQLTSKEKRIIREKLSYGYGGAIYRHILQKPKRYYICLGYYNKELIGWVSYNAKNGLVMAYTSMLYRRKGVSHTLYKHLFINKISVFRVYRDSIMKMINRINQQSKPTVSYY